MVKIMDNPYLKWMIWGVPLFSETPICLLVCSSWGFFFPPNSESTFSLVCENGQSETSMSPICQVTCVTSFKKLHQKKRLSPIPFFPSPPLASAGGRIFVMGTWQEKTCLPFQHPWSVKSYELLGHCMSLAHRQFAVQIKAAGFRRWVQHPAPRSGVPSCQIENPKSASKLAKSRWIFHKWRLWKFRCRNFDFTKNGIGQIV